ncbi:AAA family ATPase [Arthrobacter sp. NPDC093128]|uniref:AAA family ATPase n=1 Tax=Arthrobacter sp. NPDC093128 TaxID=3154979 RepID=UPI003413875C
MSAGGQRQRAFLGQGIAQQDLILLDEPTTGLDADAQDGIARILQSEKDRGATVVCVSHDPAALAAADDVKRLEAGRLTV